MRQFDGCISTLILKTTAACNLACPYCYMFSHVDQSFMGRPRLIPTTVQLALAHRLNEYLTLRSKQHRLLVILHGGEPLLLGAERFTFLAATLRSIEHGDRLDLALQTNGTALTPDVLRACRQYEITVGISLDGPPELTDRTRPIAGASRGSSYARILKGIRMAQTELPAALFSGLIAVIDLSVSGAAVYQHFRDLGIDHMDFLLPLRNHLYTRGYGPSQKASAPYGRWLAEAFDAWITEDNPAVRIRILSSVMELLLGAGAPRADIHHSAMDVITVETDGAIEPVDDLRVAGADFNRTRFNVLRDGFDAFLSSPKFQELCALDEGPPPVPCSACNYFSLCGGGGLAYRRTPDGFDAPSIYCEDIKHFVGRIAEFVSNA